MGGKILVSILVLSLLFISACVETPVESDTTGQEPAEVGVVGEPTKEKEVATEEEPKVEEAVKAKEEMSPEIKEFLGIAEEKIKSLNYNYKGPETDDFFYEFFVKGDNIKYNTDPDYKTIDIDDDAYDTIYLNKETKTAAAYCDDRKCKVKGKKADLDYDEYYIWTPLDWLDKIESAEKIGEQLIEQRDTWKLSINDGGTIWIDTFYGVPMQVEFAGEAYKFQNMKFNGLKDDGVIPVD